jgi:shikimate dehydrogenase
VAGVTAALAGTHLHGRRAVVLGSGAMARAAACALGSRGARVTVHARDASRAATVAGLVGGDVGSWPVASAAWDVLFNATPVGSWPDVQASPVPPGVLAGGLVCDALCSPPESALVRAARAAGCRVVDGAALLVARAAVDVAWWTGIAPPVGVMEHAARHRLGGVGAGARESGLEEVRP